MYHLHRDNSEIFGLSNFAAWEVIILTALQGVNRMVNRYSQVAEVVGICKANDYVLPKIYQV